MRRMSFDDVMGFYTEGVFGSSKGLQPKGFKRGSGSSTKAQNIGSATRFIEGLKGFDEARNDLHGYLSGKPMTLRAGVFLRLVLSECPINAPYFAFSDVSEAVVTIEPIPVPKRLYDRHKRKWQRSGKTLPFDFPFRAWQDREGSWWCYEADLLRFLAR